MVCFKTLTSKLTYVSYSRYTMASASADNIKQWKFPDGNFIQNLGGHNAILNCLAVNSDGVLVSGGKDIYISYRTSLICYTGYFKIYILNRKNRVRLYAM